MSNSEQPTNNATNEPISWLKKFFIYAKEPKIRSWIGFFFIAYFAGMFSTLIWLVSFHWLPIALPFTQATYNGNGSREASQDKLPKYVPGQLIVKLKEGKILTDIESITKKYKMKDVRKLIKKMPSPQERLQAAKNKLQELEASNSPNQTINQEKENINKIIKQQYSVNILPLVHSSIFI